MKRRMMKMKKLIAVLLTACMMFLVVPAVSAEDTQSETATVREIVDLDSYAQQMSVMFYIDGYTNPFDTMYSLSVTDDQSKGDEFFPIFEEIRNLKDALADGDVKITKEQLINYYDRLDAIARGFTVDRSELQFLFDLCRDEQNLNSYYPEEMWSNFTEKRAVAEAVIADETIVDIRVSDAYWELKFAYDELYSVNPTTGDIDFDGEADITDVTLIQRYCADMVYLNTSQRTMGALHRRSSKDEDVDITDATILQRYLAGMITEITSQYYHYYKTYPVGRIYYPNGYFESKRFDWIIDNL